MWLRMVLSGVLAWALALAITAGSAWAATPPQTQLIEVEAAVAGLEEAADAPAKAALTEAAEQLATVTQQSLWVDPADAVPPPEGSVVFTDSAAASNDLKSVYKDPTVPRGALLDARAKIREAQLDLAVGTDEQVIGSPGTTGSAPLAKWETAFRLLGREISRAATSVPQSTIEQAASAALASESILLYVPAAISGPALEFEAKPELMFYSSEGCPFCAVSRWALTVALSQFGRFSSLSPMVSSTTDAFPSTHTLTFYNSTFRSKYVAFVPIEAFTNQPGTLTCGEETFPYWSPLQTPTASESETLDQFDESYEGCPFLPFLDAANQWAQVGEVTTPEVIAGQSWQQITGDLSNPASTAGEALDGAAEIVSAEICTVDGARPSRVCNSKVIHAYEQAIGATT